MTWPLTPLDRDIRSPPSKFWKWLGIGLVIFFIGWATVIHVLADRNNNPHSGNNGQCRKLQSSFPPEIQDYPGCHSTFTGKGHNDPEPLP